MSFFIINFPLHISTFARYDSSRTLHLTTVLRRSVLSHIRHLPKQASPLSELFSISVYMSPIPSPSAHYLLSPSDIIWIPSFSLSCSLTLSPLSIFIHSHPNFASSSYISYISYFLDLTDLTMDGINDGMDSFTAPATGPMPRWKRKALETSSSHNNATNIANSQLRDTTPHATPLPAKSPLPTPVKSTKRPKVASHDRFIPNRNAMDFDLSSLALGKENGMYTNSQISDSPYPSLLAASLLNQPMPLLASDARRKPDLTHSKVLAFSNKAPAVGEGYLNPNRVLYNHPTSASSSRRSKFRHIPQKPEKILDAPGLQEDFYLNLVDWGSNNVLAVALANSIYLWNADSGSIEHLCDAPGGSEDSITSLSWIPNGDYLAVGTDSNEVQIWDVAGMKLLRTMESHSARVGTLAWNGHMLSSGARNGAIHNHDVRVPSHHTASLVSHTQEVCGLKWSPNGMQLASGANDNTVCIWDAQSGNRWAPRHRLTQHNAAVKALAWCPWQTNLLATGGGTADRHLRFWNSMTGSCVNSIDTRSQVCSIVWSPHDKELLTSHGFSQNQLTLWKYPSLTRMTELKGHTSRVLHTSLGPDGQTVVSGAADETLRFWKVFADGENEKRRRAETPGKGLESSLCPRSIR